MSELIEKFKKVRNNGSKRQAHIDLSNECIQEVESLERQLAETMNKLNKIESVCNGYKAMQSEYETCTEISYWDIMNIIKETTKGEGRMREIHTNPPVPQGKYYLNGKIVLDETEYTNGDTTKYLESQLEEAREIFKRVQQCRITCSELEDFADKFLKEKGDE